MGIEGEPDMSWKESDTVSLRTEFVLFAQQSGSNIRALCRRYQVSPRTAYKWLKRYREEGLEGLQDRSRRPRHSPRSTAPETVQTVLALREETGWGGRKIARVMHHNKGKGDIPHPNTITDILRRSGRLDPAARRSHTPYQRFEYREPNELWQMDFKGHFAMLEGRCHPLTVLDDHSRFCLGLQACGDETGATVQQRLQSIFRQYGLPKAILCDNGGPWGSGYPQLELTHLAVWLIRLGVQPLHGQPAHPQTQGKEERFHRTLKVELLQGRSFANLADCQRHFDPWRDRYNTLRPHEALHLDTPIQHYRPSQRVFPESLPPVEYNGGEWVRKVQKGGEIYFHDRPYRVGKGLASQQVALRPTEQDGILDVYFCTCRLRRIDVRTPDC
jgi:transposase InsO family protein